MNVSKTKTCIVEECGRYAMARGLCPRHYKQWQNHGHVLPIARSIKAPNEFVDCGEYVAVVLYDKNGVEQARAKIDKTNLDKIKGVKWSYQQLGYASGWYEGKRITMHQLVSGRDGITDHINGDRLDNRNHNLRKVTARQNSQNAKISSNNSTGYKGVFRFRDRYRVAITVNGKRVHVGCYKTAEEAGIGYDMAALKYFGEYAKTNFSIQQENANDL